MKIRLSTILTIWVLLSSAQQDNVAHHAGTHHTYNMVALGQRCYYLEQTLPLPGCCFEELNLVALNSHGQVQYRKLLFGYSWLSRCRLLVTPDQRFIIYGMTDLVGCDYGNSETKICLADTLGNVTASLTIPSEIHDLQVSQDGSYFVLDQDKILHYNGASLLKTILPALTSQTAVLPMSNKRLLISHSVGGWGYLSICDSAGATLKSITTTSVLRRLSRMGDGTIIGLSGGHLKRYNDTLKELANTFSTLPSSLNIRDYVSRNDSVFAVAEDANGKPSYLLFRDDLSLQYNYAGNVTHTHPTGIAVNGGTIHLIAEATSQTPTHIFTSYFNCGLSGQFTAKQDVGVTGYQVVHAAHQLSGYTVPVGILNLDATIRNFGTDTVHAFTLNHFRMVSGTSYCLIGLNKLFLVPVPPGDSVIVRTGTFLTSQFNNYAPNLPYGYHLCLYTSVPNHQSDAQAGNDASCRTVTLFPNALAESQRADGIRIFPNPSNGSFVISSDAGGHAIDVFNARGQFIFSKVLEEKEEIFELLQPAGLYVLRLRGGLLSKTLKVIVE